MRGITIRSLISSTITFALVASLAATGPTRGALADDPIGKITTLANVPATPGFPEGIAVNGNHIYVSGPATFGTAGTGPSAIRVFDRKTGALVTTISVAGEALAFEHALSNVAVDGQGRIYALSTQLGLIRFTKQGQSYVQQGYGAPLPDLPRCADVAPGTGCSPTLANLPPIPNDIVFDDFGFAYVTDSFQATVFRYAPGGGAPQIWFQSALFEGDGFLPFGANGIRLNPEREHVYIAVSTSAAAPNVGTIYRLPLVNAPIAADLEVVHAYTAGETPDQVAFDTQGNLYVTLALSNQISKLAPNGTELARFQSAPGDAIPLDAPAAIAFDSRTKSLLIVNHAILSANPAHFAVLRMFVGNPGNPLDKPLLP
ncbi:MAG: SMP-30/gluconolactonase/LRE family protein [Blastocatellia bacterium]